MPQTTTKQTATRKLTVRIEATLFALRSAVPLDNANSYQQKQQTELGHAIFSIDSS